MKFLDRESANPASLSAQFRRSGLLVASAVILLVGAALAQNWNWFAAIGGVPIVLALLPGGVMLAFALRTVRLSRPSVTLSRETIDAGIPDEFKADCCVPEVNNATARRARRER